MRWTLRLVLLSVLIVGLTVTPTHSVSSAYGIVRPNVFTDDAVKNGNCTLREAILGGENRDGCPDFTGVIELQAGTYTISIPGWLEDEGLTGDFDIHDSIEIRGTGIDQTFVDANQLDRIFDIHSGHVTITDMTITHGRLEGGEAVECGQTDGGGIYSHGYSLKLYRVKLIDNAARVDSCSSGGAIYTEDSLTVEDSWFEENRAETGVAAIDSHVVSPNHLTVRRSKFVDNHGYQSGAISMGSVGLIEDSQFRNNTSFSELSGAIEVRERANLLIRHSLFEGNDSGEETIHSNGILTIADSVFRNNGTSALQIGSGAVVIQRTLFEQDGIALEAGRLELVNSTVLGKSNLEAIWARGGELLLQQVTLVSQGAGLVVDGSRVEIHSSILAGSEQPCRFNSGSLRSLGHNLLQIRGSCSQINTGLDRWGTGSSPLDPRLGPLADNGGPTHTMALLPGSPAINTGEPVNCPLTDQRGVGRPQGPVCDVGAYEVEGEGSTSTEPTEGQQPGEVRLYLPVVTH